METEEIYVVGDLFRKEIKNQRLTNGYCIKALQDAGIEMSDAKFSNKIYGIRDKFTQEEIDVMNRRMGTNFSN